MVEAADDIRDKRRFGWYAVTPQSLSVTHNGHCTCKRRETLTGTDRYQGWDGPGVLVSSSGECSATSF